MPLKQQMIMPSAIQRGHAKRRGANPEQAAVGDDIHCRGGIPGVPHAEHVIEEAHDEDGR